MIEVRHGTWPFSPRLLDGGGGGGGGRSLSAFRRLRTAGHEPTFATLRRVRTPDRSDVPVRDGGRTHGALPVPLEFDMCSPGNPAERFQADRLLSNP